MAKNQKALTVIFGGSGDLAYRKLYPAIYKLYKEEYLNKNFAVIGTARRPWTDEYYREIITESIDDLKSSDEDAKEFASHFYYLSHNINDSQNYQELQTLSERLDDKYEIKGNRLFYFSVSPKLFGTIAYHLKEEGLTSTKGYQRLIIEKPFGTNLKESNTLNEKLLEAFKEEEIYRIDHYLGKEMVQAIPLLRFGNPLIKKIWNKDYLSNIQITLAEDIGVEDRGAYYEQSGAVRDMAQNHILQLVSLLLMNEPENFDSQCICKEKVRALKQLVPINEKNFNEHIVRAQYTKSEDFPELLDYRSENEVSADSEVETFIAAKIESKDEKWKEVPLYFRTGKRMRAKNTQIDLVFKKDLPLLFDNLNLSNNVLSIHIGPEEGISLKMNSKAAGMELEAEKINLEYKEDQNLPDDYERLLLNVLEANKTSFVHAEEVAESWKYIDSIRAAWKNSHHPLHFYPVMTNGPKEAIKLIEKDQHQWIWD
ncbi:MAG: glucose-6-phosphate dehydrogenase [Atopostipes suicloacalis]|nr:glucose-6-phosphate dehydrogenase [Atopostipes suicloacalis]